MPRLSRLFSRLALFSLATTAILKCLSALTLAADPLPAEIPTHATTVEALVEQTTKCVGKMERSYERYNLLVSILSDVHAVPFEQRQMLTKFFEEDALEIADEQLLFGSRGVFFIASPDLALKFARQTKQQRFREAWLSNLVAYYLTRDRVLGEEILATIETPEFRAAAHVWIARDSSSDFNQAQAALAEAKRLGIPTGSFGSASPVVAYVLARFARSHLPEIVEFVRSQFPVDDTVSVLCVTASECRRNHQSKEAAGLMKAAAELVPQSSAPVNPTKTLLAYGYAIHNREDALRLFDKYLAEWVSKLQPWELREIQKSFVGTDPATALANAEEVAPRWNLTTDEVLATAISNIVVAHGPGFPMQWIQELPDSLQREQAVASIASALKTYIANTRPDASLIQEWLNKLSERAVRILDERAKFFACREVTELAEAVKVNVPEAFRSTYLRQLEQEAKNGRAHVADYLHLLSLDKQRQEIDRHWQLPVESFEPEVGRIRMSALLIRKSSLSDQEKRAWFVKLLPVAREIKDLNWRASTLSALGTALGGIDSELSLQVHWEELALAKRLGLKPTIHDWSDGLGSMHALASPEEAIKFTFRTPNGIDDRTLSVIWEFARKLEEENDRNAVLEAIGRLLIEKQDYSRAAAIAELLSTPARQAHLSANIVRARTTKSKGM